MKFITVSAILLLAGCAQPFYDPFPPSPGVQAKVYEGPVRPQDEVATVFISDGRPHYESGFLCHVDRRQVQPDGSCVSVAYLLPGTYTMGVRYQSNAEVGKGEIVINVRAGRLYQLNFTSLRHQNLGRISMIPMPVGAKVSYRNVAPNLFPAAQLDQPVPYPVP